MRALLAAALALPLFVDTLERTARESTTGIRTFNSSRTSTDFDGPAVTQYWKRRLEKTPSGFLVPVGRGVSIFNLHASAVRPVKVVILMST